MSDLHTLAEAVGVALQWRDAKGEMQVVGDDALVAVLTALGYPAETESTIRGSLSKREDERRQPPALITADAGWPLTLPEALLEVLPETIAAELVDEAGGTTSHTLERGVVPPIDAPGYYRLHVAGYDLALAIAPQRCFGIEAVSDARLWGAGVQIYALRDRSPRAYGGFGELAGAARALAARGADALAISPVHALYPGSGAQFSPYSPSSRLFLNTSFADPASVGLPPLPDSEAAPLIDWAGGVPERLRNLRAAYEAAPAGIRIEAAAWAAEQDDTLRRHALYDALFCRYAPEGAHGWHGFPAPLHDPDGEAAQRYAAENAAEVDFHLFAQWLAEHGLANAQATARDGGMKLGLISDLAVGVNSGGSDGWALGKHMLRGLSIGAPPDPLGPEGQDWGLTSFSPRGLEATGFAPWIAMLRTALRHAGGVRIDHAFGLARLWLVPHGGGALNGAYVTYPFTDFQRLIALESYRAQAIVVAEDLGTAPWRFAETMIERDILGMRVLWFEREWDGTFTPPDRYTARSVAMSATHDTPTVAGWWRGRDIAWGETIGRFADEDKLAAEYWVRGEERAKLWQAIGGLAPEPRPEDAAPVVAAALAHVGHAVSRLAIVPIEDLTAEEETVNVPGTTDQHPNWRRRLPAPLDELLADPATEARIQALDTARKG